MKAGALLLAIHARVHAADLDDGGTISFFDMARRGLTDDFYRRRVPGFNSAAWYVWHCARAEDAMVSLLLMGQLQVLDQNGSFKGWGDRIGTSALA